MVISAVPIGRDPAQRLARQELSKAIYHQTSSVPQAVVNAIEGFLQRLFSGASTAAPGGWWSLVALAAFAVAVIAVIVVRIGPFAGSGRRGAYPMASRDTRPLTARQLRDAAAASAAAGDYSTAILQRLRAIVSSCEERGILVPDAGRTADELAAQAGARFPARGAELREAARLFDRIRYGDGTGTPAGYDRLRDLDDALARSDPGTRSGAGTTSGTGTTSGALAGSAP
ncbi:MAG TPA: DUF4129 domain-containing protein [Trebonia sp.]|nr:DUF4129 domain-containing protein [Trebonia sp.]